MNFQIIHQKKEITMKTLFIPVLAGFLILSWNVEAKTPSLKVAAEEAASAQKDKTGTSTTKWVPAVDPKPLGASVKKGLAWLVENQHSNGGWSQGEESGQMRSGQPEVKGVPNVADTCVAALALLREGSTPSKGAYAKHLAKAVEFVCAEIEASDKDSLFITGVRNTRVQSKLGTYIDTFLASMLLAEVKDRMPDVERQKRVEICLNKVMAKVEKNQKADGSFDNQGWAPALAQSMASKGMNRAAQNAAPVSDAVRERAEMNSRKSYDKAAGKFSGTGTAGVELYGAVSVLSGMQDADNTNQAEKGKFEKQLKEAKTESEKKQAQGKLDRIAKNQEDLEHAREKVVQRLDDKAFVSGFGSSGGEEFLSYMNIGESLVVKGGDAWRKWDQSMTENINRIHSHPIKNANFLWDGCDKISLLSKT